ncbi:hypothetical protein ACJBCE_36710 [Streptomyces sp. NBUL23]|uniref:hypothetical protein n=1 Tax=Streptomyces sp. NBUL23 TaxID=3381354 RepID=UPI0038710C8D
MRKRSNGRAADFFRSKPVTAAVLMAVGASLLALGLPSDWIDLGALTLAAMTVRPAGTVPPRPARQPRRTRGHRTGKLRATKRRPSADTR